MSLLTIDFSTLLPGGSPCTYNHQPAMSLHVPLASCVSSTPETVGGAGSVLFFDVFSFLERGALLPGSDRLSRKMLVQGILKSFRAPRYYSARPLMTRRTSLIFLPIYVRFDSSSKKIESKNNGELATAFSLSISNSKFAASSGPKQSRSRNRLMRSEEHTS